VALADLRLGELEGGDVAGKVRVFVDGDERRFLSPGIDGKKVSRAPASRNPDRDSMLPLTGLHPRRNRTKRSAQLRTAPAGVLGPPLFAAALAAMTALQYDFMLGIGWRPFADPSGAWPSGLALGPHGWVMDLGFAVSGILLMAFALGVHGGLPRGSEAGPALLFLSGGAMALLAFETDPIRRAGPRSWHGLVHDAAFIVFAAALILALLALWRRMRGDPAWRRHAHLTLATAVVCTACLVLPGVAYYLFLAAALAWIEMTALRLRASIRPPG
jgi:uncharacterized membrane protein YidH (DUF202 family)